jgi:hypothetical protein
MAAKWTFHESLSLDGMNLAGKVINLLESSPQVKLRLYSSMDNRHLCEKLTSESHSAGLPQFAPGAARLG